MSERCGTCDHWIEPEKQPFPGWRICAPYRKSYEFSSPNARCFFTPSKWVARQDEKAA